MIPIEDIRTNLDTFAVPTCYLPAVAHFMHDALPNEPYDPHFNGQPLITTYYDTKDFNLRKAATRATATSRSAFASIPAALWPSPPRRRKRSFASQSTPSTSRSCPPTCALASWRSPATS